MAKTQAPTAPRAAVATTAPPSTRRRGRIGPLTIVHLVVLELAALALEILPVVDGSLALQNVRHIKGAQADVGEADGQAGGEHADAQGCSPRPASL